MPRLGLVGGFCPAPVRVRIPLGVQISFGSQRDDDFANFGSDSKAQQVVRIDGVADVAFRHTAGRAVKLCPGLMPGIAQLSKETRRPFLTRNAAYFDQAVRK